MFFFLFDSDLCDFLSDRVVLMFKLTHHYNLEEKQTTSFCQLEQRTQSWGWTRESGHNPRIESMTQHESAALLTPLAELRLPSPSVSSPWLQHWESNHFEANSTVSQLRSVLVISPATSQKESQHVLSKGETSSTCKACLVPTTRVYAHSQKLPSAGSNDQWWWL